MVCDTTTPGPVKRIGLFATDDCFTPTYGVEAGFVDDCATVGDVSPETEDTREEFLKTCPNGDIRAYVPARTVTKFTEVTLNFPWLPIEWLSVAGAVEPIMFNGEIVGYGDCETAINLIAVIEQEALGGDACSSSATPSASSILTVYTLRDVRITQDGTVGTSDFNYQVIGRTQKASIGSGPVPLFFDSATPTVAQWPDDCLSVCAKGVTFKGFGLPEECGSIDTTAPPIACVPAS